MNINNKYIAIIFCIILLISISIFIIISNNKKKNINDNVNKFNQTLDNINTLLIQPSGLATKNCVSESGINELNNLYLSLEKLNVLKMDVENVFPSSNISFDIPRKEILSNIDKLVNKIKAWQKSPLCKNLCTDVGQVYNPNQNTCVCNTQAGWIHDTVKNICKCNEDKGWTLDLINNSCMCDSSKNLIHDKATNSCICDPTRNFIYDKATNSCICDPTKNLIHDKATNSCICDPNKGMIPDPTNTDPNVLKCVDKKTDYNNQLQTIEKDAIFGGFAINSNNGLFASQKPFPLLSGNGVGTVTGALAPIGPRAHNDTGILDCPRDSKGQECSGNPNYCNRTTGTCSCFIGYTGDKCQNYTGTVCPTDSNTGLMCSGNGYCYNGKCRCYTYSDGISDGTWGFNGDKCQYRRL